MFERSLTVRSNTTANKNHYIFHLEKRCSIHLENTKNSSEITKLLGVACRRTSFGYEMLSDTLCTTLACPNRSLEPLDLDTICFQKNESAPASWLLTKCSIAFISIHTRDGPNLNFEESPVARLFAPLFGFPSTYWV